MPTPSRSVRVRLATAVLAAAASLGLVAATPATTAAEPTVRYVALGDSFSAGSGISPLDPSVTPLCARSLRNYPHVLAATLAPDTFTDATCGGAQTNDFTRSQYLGVPAQLDRLAKDTTLVTLTIGGNDNGTFVGAIAACGSAGMLTLGLGSPCKDLYGDRFVNDVVNKTGPAVRAALAAIRDKAPRAKVYIVGYPWLLPPTKGCFLTMPIARGDVPYLRTLQATLNDVIRQAAADTSTTYVDLSVVSEGHDACQKVGTRWVEPAFWGTNFVPVHPNALGEQKMADAVLAARH